MSVDGQTYATYYLPCYNIGHKPLNSFAKATKLMAQKSARDKMKHLQN